jgi:hypothetical protein
MWCLIKHTDSFTLHILTRADDVHTPLCVQAVRGAHKVQELSAERATIVCGGMSSAPCCYTRDL